MVFAKESTKVRFVEVIPEKVGMEIEGKIWEVLPATTQVGETRKMLVRLDGGFRLNLYQGQWEDTRQKANCRICSTSVSLPEGVAGEAVLQFAYTRNCLIDIKIVFGDQVVEHLMVKDKWCNDHIDGSMCVVGETEELLLQRRRKELIQKCEDLQEKCSNRNSKDFYAVSSLHRDIDMATDVDKLNRCAEKLADIEKALYPCLLSFETIIRSPQ